MPVIGDTLDRGYLFCERGDNKKNYPRSRARFSSLEITHFEFLKCLNPTFLADWLAGWLGWPFPGDVDLGAQTCPPLGPPIRHPA